MRIELHLKSKQDITLSFLHIKQSNYLEALKIKQLKTKMVKMCHILKLQK